MSMTFTKLASTLPGSSVWCAPYATRIVWVTMLALADQNGVVEASIPGLARIAGVTLEECKEALDTFMAPDEYSSSPEYDGRRIERIDRGWRLLNYRKYRDTRDSDAKREADRERQRKHRELSRSVTTCHTPSQEIAQAEAEAEAEEEKNKPPLTPPVKEVRFEVEAFDGERFVREAQKAWPRCSRSTAEEYACLEAYDRYGKEHGMRLSEAAAIVNARIAEIAKLVSQWPQAKRKFIPELITLMRNPGKLDNTEFWEPEPEVITEAQIGVWNGKTSSAANCWWCGKDYVLDENYPRDHLIYCSAECKEQHEAKLAKEGR